jgi:hypothetical protein
MLVAAVGYYMDSRCSLSHLTTTSCCSIKKAEGVLLPIRQTHSIDPIVIVKVNAMELRTYVFNSPRPTSVDLSLTVSVDRFHAMTPKAMVLRVDLS